MRRPQVCKHQVCDHCGGRFGMVTHRWWGNGVAPEPSRRTRLSPVYYEPTPALFNAYTYGASVQLAASGSKHKLQGEFRFPRFSAAPNVSVQIIASISAVPMQVSAVQVSETIGASGSVETKIVVEAETIFDVPASGSYYANLVDGLGGFASGSAQDARTPSFAVTGAAQ